MFAEKSYQSGHILIDANGDLVLFSVRKDDQGVYSCQALNLAGTATADVRLNVEGMRLKSLKRQLRNCGHSGRLFVNY